MLEVIEGAELGEAVEVAAFFRADSPAGADLARARGDGVVLAFAVLAADGMDGGHVEHIEAQRLQVGQLRLYIAERPVGLGIRALRTREELVPGGKTGLFAVHLDRKRAGVAGLEVGIRVALS